MVNRGHDGKVWGPGSGPDGPFTQTTLDCFFYWGLCITTLVFSPLQVNREHLATYSNCFNQPTSDLHLLVPVVAVNYLKIFQMLSTFLGLIQWFW